MKKIAEVIQDSNIDSKLIKAVVRHLGDKSCIKDVVTHGIDGGFPGFTYYSDTVAFFKKYRKQIIDLVENMAAELGEDEISFVANFNCLNYESDKEGKREIQRALYGKLHNDDTQVPNALTWFAAEEVCRAFLED